MTPAARASSAASPSCSSARSRCSWCRPGRQRMRSRSRISRRPGARCSATRSRTSPPTNAARRNFSAAASSWSGCPARAARSRARRCARALDGQWGGPHHVSPSVLSLSQATECGTIYRVAEIRELADIAHARGLAVHIDGARLGNALARMNVSPAEATWKAGVDALSFGATKGGAMGAEAVIFFDPGRGAHMQDRRKRGGAPPRQAPLHRGADGGLLRRRSLAQARAPRQRDGGRLAAGLTAAGCQAGMAGRGERGVRALPARIDAAAQGGRRALLSLAHEHGGRMARRGRVGWRADAARDVVRDHQEDVDRFLATRRHDCGASRHVAPKLRPIAGAASPRESCNGRPALGTCRRSRSVMRWSVLRPAGVRASLLAQPVSPPYPAPYPGAYPEAYRDAVSGDFRRCRPTTWPSCGRWGSSRSSAPMRQGPSMGCAPSMRPAASCTYRRCQGADASCRVVPTARLGGRVAALSGPARPHGSRRQRPARLA